MHLHACAGVEAGIEHTNTHYADNGFLFGDHHVEDDGDDREVGLLAAVNSKVQPKLPDYASPSLLDQSIAPLMAQLLTVAAPGDPPIAIAPHSPHFAPPLRGPPSSLA